MSAIARYGFAFPAFRISGQVLHPGQGKKSWRSICYTDEDLITLSFRACADVIDEDARPDAILFATSTPVFKDRYHSSFLADLLGLNEGILALDIISTARAGSDALLMAHALISSGQHQNILLVAAHVDFPPVGEELQHVSGHAAVAMIISADAGTAEIRSVRSYSSSLAEEFSYKGEKTEYDPRFSRSAGFKANMTKAWNNTDPKPDTTGTLIINSSYTRMVLGMVRKSGFDPEQQLYIDPILPMVGHTGSCHALLLIISAMEHRTGSVLLCDYLNGMNVVALHVQGTPPDTRLSDLRFTEIASYQDYLKLRKRGDFADSSYRSQEMFSSEMMMEREKEQMLRLEGQECTACHAVFLIKTARCHHCHGTTFIRKILARTGTVYTLTAEHYFPSSFPPITMVVIDLDGGGRMTVQQTDDMYPDEEHRLRIGDRVELVYRSMMENDKKPNYFWKCVRL